MQCQFDYVYLTVSLWVSVPLHLSPHSWFILVCLWPTFLVAYHLTLSSLRGGYFLVLMLPWFNGSLVWAMYLVVDPIYKVIVVASYLCISVRWIIYHIDTLDSCHLLPWWFSSDQQFSFLMADLRLLHASVMQLLHDHLLVPVWGNILSVISFWRGVFPIGFSPLVRLQRLHCTWVPNMASLPGPNSSHLILHFLSFVGLRHFPKLHLRGVLE